jgi:hypothetical protein
MRVYPACIYPVHAAILDPAAATFPVDDVASTIQQVLIRDDTRQQPPGPTKFPAFLGLDRSQWEKPAASEQCATAETKNTNCWLCGSVVDTKQTTMPDGSVIRVCGNANKNECEHVLPASFMMFLKTLINRNNTNPEPKLETTRLFYDASCNLCNNKKSDGLYVKAFWQSDGTLRFEPHLDNIIHDIVLFIIAVRCNTGEEVFSSDASGEDRRLPPWPGVPATYGGAVPPIAVQGPQDEDWPASALPPAINWPDAGRDAKWVNANMRTAPRCDPEEVVAGFAAAAAAAVAAAAFVPPAAVHFFTYKKTTVKSPPPQFTKYSVSVNTFASVTSLTKDAVTQKFHNPARAYIELTAAVPSAPGAAAPGIDVGTIETELAGDPTMVGVNPGLLAIVQPSKHSSALASLRNAGVVSTVDRDKAWTWINRRFSAIYSRVQQICVYLNGAANRSVVDSTRQLATRPILDTDAKFINLGAIPNLQPPPVPLAPAGGRRLRFTIRRRSESRQTKKNRRRRVIEVRV